MSSDSQIEDDEDEYLEDEDALENVDDENEDEDSDEEDEASESYAGTTDGSEEDVSEEDGEREDEEDEPKNNEPQWDQDPIASMRRLEAVLFLARRPLTSRKLSQLAGLEDGTQARTMVANLNKHYDAVSRAFHVKRVSGGFQLMTRPQFFKWIRRLEHVPRSRRLSPIMMETLSVVAYRQPIIKAEIEAIRGVSCGEMLRQLLEVGLVKIAGRSPELGRPFLYATSKEFLVSFGLNSLDDLPRADVLAGKGLPQWANPDHDSHSEIGAIGSFAASDNADVGVSTDPTDQDE